MVKHEHETAVRVDKMLDELLEVSLLGVGFGPSHLAKARRVRKRIADRVLGRPKAADPPISTGIAALETARIYLMEVEPGRYVSHGNDPGAGPWRTSSQPRYATAMSTSLSATSVLSDFLVKRGEGFPAARVVSATIVLDKESS